MHILILSDHCLPEIKAPSFRIRDHARYWLEAGHEVTVVTCAPNSPHGKVFPGYKNRFYSEEWQDGVRVIRIWSYMQPNRGVFLRTLDYISFALSCILLCWKFPKHDIIVATSPPLFVAMAGYVVSRLRRRPWVFELRDLWPASIAAVGATKTPALRFIEKIELFLYRRADGVISLTDAFVEDITRRGAHPKNLTVISNGVDTGFFNADQATFDARERLGIANDKTIAAYVGTVGLAHGLETLIDCAENCRDHEQLHFLILGEGADRERIEELVASKGLKNVTIHDFVPQTEIPAYWRAIDIAIVHLKPHPVFKTVIPSKIFEIMAMGVPMVYGVEGESADIVRETGAGECIPSGDAEAMTQSVLRLAEDRDLRDQLGENGRTRVSERFSRKVKASEMAEFLQRLLRRK